MKLSVIIPAYNEAESLPDTVNAIYGKLMENNITHEIIVVDDNSKDHTEEILGKMKEQLPTLMSYLNKGPNGFGYAVRYGLERFSGDFVAIVMADLSDS